MKQLTLKLILPLSVISFATLTKWWYALPVDAPGTFFTGFPFPFVCDGWHTSMSLQIFVTEFFVDFLAYLLIWILVIFCINRFWRKINPTKWLTIFLWSIAGLIICGASFIAANPDHKVYLKRPFDMEVKESGFRFIWEEMEHMDNPTDDGQDTKNKKNNHLK
jgi:hypothetical protein